MAISGGSGVSQYGNSELDFSTSQTWTHEIDVEGTTAINVTPNASVTLTGEIKGTDASKDLLSVSGGGSLAIKAATSGLNAIAVSDKGTFLELGGATTINELDIGDGATVSPDGNLSLSTMMVGANATLDVMAGQTVSVAHMPTSSNGVSHLKVTGGGILSIATATDGKVTIADGRELIAGTTTSLNGQALTAFRAGDVFDLSNLDATLATITANYNAANGALEIRQNAALKAKVALPAGLDGTFTVTTDGQHGTAVQLTTATDKAAPRTADATAIRLPQATASYGLDGSGVTVGIISDTFNTRGGAAQDIVNGSLPSDLRVLTDGGNPNIDDGREMAQLLHAAAPGAALLFARSGDSVASMAATVNNLIQAGARIIVDDVGFIDEPFWQSAGALNQAINAAAAAGIIFVTAAGDAGNAYYTHPYILTDAALPGNLGSSHAYDFNLGQGTPNFLQRVTLSDNGVHTVGLQWDQPVGQVDQLLTLHVLQLQDDGTYKNVGIVSRATNGTAAEETVFSGKGTFYFAVTGSDLGSSGVFKYLLADDGNAVTIDDPNAGRGAGDIYGHALNANEITVGEVAYNKLSTNLAVSSAGPGEYIFDADGNRLAEPVHLNKPDVTAAVGASTDVSGILTPFNSTSAAASNVAGVVALMLQANKNLTASQIKDMLKSSAMPLNSTVQGGSGLVQADKAVALAALTNGGAATVDYAGKTIALATGGTLTTGAGGNTINVTDTGTVLSHGPDWVNAGTGLTTVSTLGSGGTVVGGAGALTVTGGPGSNTVYAGAGGLTYQGGSGVDMVVGLGQAATIVGGTGGGWFFGGGNATITAGAGGDLNLVMGGNGDRLYAAGPKGVLFGTSGGDVLMSSAADTGSSVFFGSNGSGRMTFITGAGDDLLALGQGSNDVTLGAGHAVIFGNGGTSSVSSITAGSGSLDLAFSGASTVLTIAAGAARAFNLYAYGQGQDSIHLQGYGADETANALATQRSLGGGTQLSLSDGSVVNLVGVGHATASLFS